MQENLSTASKLDRTIPRKQNKPTLSKKIIFDLININKGEWNTLSLEVKNVLRSIDYENNNSIKGGVLEIKRSIETLFYSNTFSVAKKVEKFDETLKLVEVNSRVVKKLEFINRGHIIRVLRGQKPDNLNKLKQKLKVKEKKKIKQLKSNSYILKKMKIKEKHKEKLMSIPCFKEAFNLIDFKSTKSIETFYTKLDEYISFGLGVESATKKTLRKFLNEYKKYVGEKYGVIIVVE